MPLIKPAVRSFCYPALAGGILFSILALGSSVYLLNFLNHSLVTTGTVTSVSRESDSDGYTYCPKVRFQAADKQFYTVACRTRQNEYLSVGEVVPVRYKKSDPNDAWRESQLRDLSNFSAKGGVVGAIGLCMGFALRWYARTRGISLGP